MTCLGVPCFSPPMFLSCSGSPHRPRSRPSRSLRSSKARAERLATHVAAATNPFVYVRRSNEADSALRRHTLLSARWDLPPSQPSRVLPTSIAVPQGVVGRSGSIICSMCSPPTHKFDRTQIPLRKKNITPSSLRRKASDSPETPTSMSRTPGKEQEMRVFEEENSDRGPSSISSVSNRNSTFRKRQKNLENLISVFRSSD